MLWHNITFTRTWGNKFISCKKIKLKKLRGKAFPMIFVKNSLKKYVSLGGGGGLLTVFCTHEYQ